MVTVARILVIGGLDPSGGAGITADARVLQLHGAQALPIVTALTVQNRFGFTRCEPVADDLVRAALTAAIADGPIHAIKLGLLASAGQADWLAEWLSPFAQHVPIVVDPVLSATAGGYDSPVALAKSYRQQLVPLATVFTPNLLELAAVFGDEPLARSFASGCSSVLTKGGHGAGATLQDELAFQDGVQRYQHQRLLVGSVHGTGCALASSLAALLVQGHSLTTAVQLAIDYVQRCLSAMALEQAAAHPRPLQLVSGTVLR